MRGGNDDGFQPVATAIQVPWRDTSLSVDARVADLLARLTLPEKVAQLRAAWIGASEIALEVAPQQNDMIESLGWEETIAVGLGQLTRPFGTAPVDPSAGARRLAAIQADVVAANRFGIPAVAHEECLTGLMTLGATVYPTPLAWGATFDTALVERMATQIGGTMRRLGVHQGLAPVLDVTRDARWGRTEETIGEDPYLVATIGTAYVRGLQSNGIVATLKHFAGYSASRAGRNFAPAAVGHRELADVLLPPFEMAIRDGGARAVMHSYAEVDGVPAAADAGLLTDLLRDAWGFTGTVVADYFGISFLQTQHGVAGSPGEAATLALTAGVDVELPAVRCYGAPLLAELHERRLSEAVVDRAVTRVLRQKCELGLLDEDHSLSPPDDGPVDLDPPAHRALARQVAEESVVLLANSGGVLPLVGPTRIAVVGPLADRVDGMLGCYTFPSHVASQYPETSGGVSVATVLQALREELPQVRITHAAGSDVDGEVSAVDEAVAAATGAEVCVAVLGDRAGLFGRGTSGEGCDAEDLSLPGVQGQLLDALLDTGTPVVLVLLTGRPYALGAYADRLAAVVQAFFPGEEGASAVAGILSGRVCPAGRLPISMPSRPSGPPATYLAPKLGQRGEVSTLDPTPLFPFGHGLSYTTFRWSDVTVDGAPLGEVVELPSDGAVTIGLTVTNTGDRAGAEVVQLYLHDPIAQVTRPVVRLIGYARVTLAAGESRRVELRCHADLTSFTGLGGRRIVEPGDIELRLSASSADHRHTARLRIVGKQRFVDHQRVLTTAVAVLRSSRA